MLNELAKLSFTVGQIEGTAKGLILRTDMERKKQEEYLNLIVKWSHDILELTKSLTDYKIVQPSTESQGGKEE